MTDKKEDQEQVTDIVTYNGKNFDLASDAGRGELKGYLEATSQIASKKANENHDIKISLGMDKTASLDDIKTKIANLKAEGKDEEAEQVSVDLAYESQAKLEQLQRQQLEDSWFNSYKAARPEIFDNIPEALAKDALFGKYGNALHNSEDPVQYADQILSSYVTSDEPRGTIGSSPAQEPVKAAPKPASTKEEDSFSILKAMQEDF